MHQQQRTGTAGQSIQEGGFPVNELIQVNVNGTVGTVINCGYCNHTNPNQCPQCKPTGTETCIGCLYRGGGTPTVTTTIAPGQTNDPPTPQTIIVTPSGMNQPPGHNT
jgi:hypothetical protein